VQTLVKTLVNLDAAPLDSGVMDALDVSSLHNKLVFQSESAHEVRTELSGLLTEHDLSLGRGRVNTRLFASRLQDIRIMKLSYGAQVRIRAMAFDGFALVQTPLRGAFETDTEGLRCRFGPGDVAVLSPRRDIDIHWQQGSEQLIVKIPHHLLAQTADTADERAGRHLHGQHSPQAGHAWPCPRTVFQSPVFKLSPGLIPLWHALVQQALNLSDGLADGLRNERVISALPANALPLSHEWLAHFERTLGLFVLTHQDGYPSQPRLAGAAQATPARVQKCLPRLAREKTGKSVPIKPASIKSASIQPVHAAEQKTVSAHIAATPRTHQAAPPSETCTPLARMQAYMHQRLCTPMTLPELARVAGLSPRSLNTLCQRHHGVSPMVMLRNLRLDAVRRVLRSRLAGAPVTSTTSVTSVALDHGFGHLGRFSAYYRQRFGELPRETMAAVATCPS